MPTPFDILSFGRPPAVELGEETRLVAFLGDEADKRQTALRASLLSSTSVDPDAHAKAVQLSRQSGLPPDVVERNQKEAERRAKFSSIDFDLLASKSPVLADFLSDPENAKVAHDDISALTRVSDFFRSIGSGVVQLAGSSSRGLGRFENAMDALFLEMVGKISEDAEAELRRIVPPDPANQFFIEFGTDIVEISEQIGPPPERQNLATDIGSGLGQIAGQVALFITTGGVATGLTLFTQGVDIQAEQILATGATLDRESSVKESFALLAGGTVTLATERMQLKFLTRHLPKEAKDRVRSEVRRVLTDIFKSGGAEALQEVTEGVLQNLVTKTLINSEHELFELDQASREGQAAFGAGAIARSLLLLGTKGRGPRLRNRQMAEKDLASLEEILEAAAESKTNVRSPEAFQRLVQEAAAGSGMEKVYIPASAALELFQGIDSDLFELTDELGVSDQVQEALATEGDLVVPVERFASVMANSELANTILPISRLNSDGVSIREIEEFEKAEREAIQADVELEALGPSDQARQAAVGQIREFNAERAALAKTIDDPPENFTEKQKAETEARMAEIKNELLTIQEEGTKRQKTAQTTSAIIETEILKQLKAAGRANEPAQLEAQFLTDFFRVLAIRTGRDLGDVFRSAGLRIVREEGGGRSVQPPQIAEGSIDALINELRSGKVSTKSLEAKAFGKSLSEFARDRGVKGDRGDLLGQDVDRDKRPFLRNLLRKDGISLDRLGEQAFEAGYFNARPTTAELIDAIVQDVAAVSRADRIFSLKNENQGARATLEGIEQLQEQLDRLSLSVDELTNEQIKAKLDEGELFQEGTGEARGSFALDDEGVIIRLKDAQNMSTLLHESGHMFLEIYRQIVEGGNATPEIAQDFDTIKAWFGENAQETYDWIAKNIPDQIAEIDRRGGVEYVRQQGEAIDLDRTSSDPAAAAVATSYHEFWARGFEAYLFEGKAPSIRLQDAFQRFRAWLISVYTRLKISRQKLPKAITEVMDRMLATEAEIAESELVNQYVPIEALRDQMTKAEADDYNLNAQRATGEAESILTQKVLVEVTRENRKWWKQEKAKVRAEVTEEVYSTPAYGAVWFLREGTLFDAEETTPEAVKGQKLSRAALVETYGTVILSELPKSVPPMWTNKGGLHPDAIAEIFGFGSGDQMIEILRDLKPVKAVIEEETQSRMVARHGDILNDGSIEEEAQAAAHNSARSRFLISELRILSKRSGEGFKSPVTIVRAAAKRIIGQKAVDDVMKPGRFLRAEQRSFIKMQEAIASEDNVEARVQGHKRLLNHFLYLEAVAARDVIIRDTKTLQSFLSDKKMARKKIDPDYLEKIRDVLGQFNFNPRLSEARRLRLEITAINDWMDRKRHDDNADFIHPAEIREAEARGVTHFRDMTFDEFRGLRDTVKNIERQGVNKSKWINNKDKRELADVERQIIERAEESSKRTKRSQKLETEQTLGALDKGAEAVMTLADHLSKIEQLVEFLDGGFEGPWHDFVWNIIVDAQNNTLDMQKEFGAKHLLLFEALPKDVRNNIYETFSLPVIGRTKISRMELIQMALNMGNDLNKRKLLEGYGWTEDQVFDALDILTEAEWGYVQGIWDIHEELWPLIVEHEKAMKGVPPKKIEISAVTTKFGQLKGGYFPIVYDPQRSHRNKYDFSQTSTDLFNEGYISATTVHTWTKERTNFVGEILLDGVTPVSHVNNVIYDINNRQAVMSVYKLLRRQGVKRVVTERLGRSAHNAMLKWTRAIANGQGPQSGGALNKLLRAGRMNMTAYVMGFKATVALAQLAGYANAVERMVGFKGGKRALAQATLRQLDPRYHREMVDFINDNSGEMRNRRLNVDRDIREAIERAERNNIKIRPTMAVLFKIIQEMDYFVAASTWSASYNIGLRDFNNDHDRAVRFADSNVRLSQSTGALKDLSAFQRGESSLDPSKQDSSEFVKLFGIAYTFFAAYHNRLRNVVRVARGVDQRDRSVRERYTEAFARYFWIVIVAQVFSELVSARGPEEDEDAAEWALRKIFWYNFAGIPIIREIATAADFSARDDTFNVRAGAKGSPFLRQIASPLQLLFDLVKPLLTDDEINPELVGKDLLRTIGLFTPIPGSQIEITGTNIYRYMVGETDEFALRDVFFFKQDE